MEFSQDVLQAKQSLSARLLRAGLRGRVVSRGMALRVSDAVTQAGSNVHAVGVGRKTVAGKRTSEPAVRIYVVQKLAESLLSPRDRLPAEIDGVATDVIESPPAFLLGKRKASRKSAKSPPRCTVNRQDRQRPVMGGISAAHVNVTAGTIAYFCRSTRHGDDPAQVHVLSNNHVFADVNSADVGDDAYQPGPADGGVMADHFADLHRYVTIHLGGTVPNRVDAAIVALRSGIEHDLQVCSIGRITGTQQATEDMAVRKHGRTTGYTEGKVTDEAYDALVGMDHNNPSVVALFEDQMRIEVTPPYAAIGLGGDSGSLVVAKGAAKAVGLYFAGPASGNYGVANHIGDVLNELEIQLF